MPKKTRISETLARFAFDAENRGENRGERDWVVFNYNLINFGSKTLSSIKYMYLPIIYNIYQKNKNDIF